MILPNILPYDSYNGDFKSFYEDVYKIFRNDFVNNRPVYKGRILGLKKHPQIDGKEYTFYHFTHKGDIESERIPDLRRMERIPYPSPMINQSNDDDLKVWKNKRGRNKRILIFHEQERYLVVLEERKAYILPWTAYLVENESNVKKLLKEYGDYKNAKAAQER